MAVLITGGAGYIGSHMVHEFADAGEPVVVLDNLSNGFRFLLPTPVPFVSGSTGDPPASGTEIVSSSSSSRRISLLRMTPAYPLLHHRVTLRIAILDIHFIHYASV